MRFSVSCCLWAGLCWGALTASAQVTAPSPTLSSVSPLGGRPGAAVELAFKGAELDGASAIQLTRVRDARALTVPVKQVPDKKGVLVATLPADAPAGLYDLRLVTPLGVSNPRVFQISPLKVVDSSGTNTKPEAAQAAALDSALHGVFKAGVPHWFSFEGKKGQRVLGTFAGAEWDVRTALVGSVYDGSGRELARLRDGLLELRLPADGVFKLKLHDLMFGAGDDYGYRFTLTTGPVVWAAGQGAVWGWNLPGGQGTDLRVLRGPPLEYLKADAATIAKLLEASPMTPLKAPEGLVLPGEDKLEPLSLGQVVAGWFPAKGAIRSFDLSFKKGERFIIEVASQRLGFTSDPTLLVENLKGEALTPQAEVADPAAPVPAPGTRLLMLDPVYGYEAKADGVFRLSLSDPTNAANGRRFPFQLRVRKVEEPAVDGAVAIHAKLPPAAATGPYDLPAANLWRGGALALEVWVPGRTALSEGAEITLGALPAGVTSLGGYVGRGQSLGHVVLKAAADAPAGTAVLAALEKTNWLVRPVKDNTREVLSTRLAGAPVVGIVPSPAPVFIEPAAAGVVEVAATGKAEVPLKVLRHPGCTEALKLKVLGLGDPAKAAEISIAAKAAEAKLTLDAKTLKLSPGDYVCLLQGTAKMPMQRNAEAVNAAQAAAAKAAEAQAGAKKALTEAQAALKALKPEDKAGQTAQQARIKELTAASAKADKARTEADKAAKDLAAKNAPKEVTFLVHSAPVRFRVK